MIAFPHTIWPARSWPPHAWPDDAAGYKVLSRPTPGGAETLIAFLPPGTTQYTFTGGAPNSVRYLRVVAVTSCNIEQTDPVGPGLRRVAFDANGDLVLPAPNAPYALKLNPQSGGGVQAEWAFNPQNQDVAPSTFNIYTNAGSGAVDYTAPAATLSYSVARRYQNSVGTFAHGATVKVAVRAEGTNGVEETNTTEVTITADAQAPDPVSAAGGRFATE